MSAAVPTVAPREHGLATAHFQPSRRLRAVLVAFVAVGTVTFLLGIFLAPQRLWPALLLLSFYMLGLGLAGTVFVALQYVSGASWSVAFRRVPEAMTSLIPFGAAGLLLVLVARPSLYPWTSASTELSAFRHFWLNLLFFRLRAVLFVATWLLFTRLILHASRRQDRDGSFLHTRRNLRLSALFLVIFGVTFCLSSYDWIMSLEPRWASTIFGIYNFAGLLLAGLAALTVLLIWLRCHRPLDEIINRHHLHDLGKLLFAFSTFWMYLWFCQYLLIWYANIPEETVHYVARLHGYWQPLFLLNAALNWLVPFFALLPRANKQSPSLLLKVCIVLLLGRWLDVYLMIMPPLMGAQPRIGMWEIGLTLGAIGVFTLGFRAGLRRASLVPLRDPYLPQSLHYHA